MTSWARFTEIQRTKLTAHTDNRWLARCSKPLRGFCGQKNPEREMSSYPTKTKIYVQCTYSIRSAKEKVYSVNCGHILDILSIIAHIFIISLCVQWRLCTCLLDLALCVTCCCVKFWVYFQELQEFISLAVFRSKCFFLRYSQRVLYAIIFRFQKWPSKPRDLCNYGSALLPN